jgi:acyl phosphate:glycerol-3-phosphate acyltransferase
MTALGLIGLGYFLGSIPVSVWLGRLFLKKDIRDFGTDKNPGALNAWKAGRWALGVPVLLLDFLKGALPVALAYQVVGISSWEIVPIALAPVAGHAYSPFLHFHGGKAITVSFGIWTGLTLASGPTVLGMLMAVFFFLLDSNAWAVIFSLSLFLVYLIFGLGDGTLLFIWGGNLLILLHKHRPELLLPIRLSSRFQRRMR